MPRCERFDTTGQIKWRGKMLYVSEILAKEPIALTPVDDTTWEVRYSFHLLGTLDEQTRPLNQQRNGISAIDY